MIVKIIFGNWVVSFVGFLSSWLDACVQDNQKSLSLRPTGITISEGDNYYTCKLGEFKASTFQVSTASYNVS